METMKSQLLRSKKVAIATKTSSSALVKS